MGLVLAVASGMQLAGQDQRVNRPDAWNALRPLARIGLRHGVSRHVITVPRDASWVKVREAWGEPEFVISAMDSTESWALCLPDMGVRIEVAGKSGILSTKAGLTPYMVSTRCDDPSLRFRATGENEFTVTIQLDDKAAIPPDVYLAVQPDWHSTKDKLVGIYIGTTITSWARYSLVAGLALMIPGVWLLVKRMPIAG